MLPYALVGVARHAMLARSCARSALQRARRTAPPTRQLQLRKRTESSPPERPASPPPPPPRQRWLKWGAVALGASAALAWLAGRKEALQPGVKSRKRRHGSLIYDTEQELEIKVALSALSPQQLADNLLGRALAVKALERLSTLARGARDRQLIVKNGGVAKLVDLVPEAAADRLSPATQRLLALTLTLLCSEEEIALQVVGRGGLGLLVGLLSRYDGVPLRLYERDFLVRALPSLSFARPPEELAPTAPLAPAGAGENAVSADPDASLIAFLATLTEAGDDFQQDMTRVRDVFNEWTQSDDSKGTNSAEVRSLVWWISRGSQRSSYADRGERAPYYHSIRALATLADQPVNRAHMLRSDHLLQMLRRVYRHNLYESRVQVQTARALANLAQDASALEPIVRNGFLEELIRWARAPPPGHPRTMKLESQARRALANLRAAALRKLGVAHAPCFGDEVYLMYPALFALYDPADTEAAELLAPTSWAPQCDVPIAGAAATAAFAPSAPPSGPTANPLPSDSDLQKPAAGAHLGFFARLRSARPRRAVSPSEQTSFAPSLPSGDAPSSAPRPLRDNYGFECDCPPALADAKLDVVFVHGLLGSPLTTWRTLPLRYGAEAEAAAAPLLQMRVREGDSAPTRRSSAFDRVTTEVDEWTPWLFGEEPEIELPEESNSPSSLPLPPPPPPPPPPLSPPPLAGALPQPPAQANVVPTSAREAARSLIRRGHEGLEDEGLDHFANPNVICWPQEWLPRDLCACSGNVRILSVGYHSSISTWGGSTSNLNTRSKRFLAKLKAAGVGQGEGRRVVFVTHSMGGLLVKQILADADEDPRYRYLLENTAGVAFYATPHLGVWFPQLAKFAGVLVRPSSDVEDLAQGSATLLALNEKMRSFKHVQLLSFGESRSMSLGPLFRTVVVPAESANPGVGAFRLLDADHLGICKPAGRSDPIYSELVDWIHGVVSLPRTAARGGGGGAAPAADDNDFV